MSIPDKPVTRKEMFYDGILNGNVVPEPITREEMYLAEIAKNSGTEIPSIVKLDSMADFENLTNKTADWYFIKED